MFKERFFIFQFENPPSPSTNNEKGILERSKEKLTTSYKTKKEELKSNAKELRTSIDLFLDKTSVLSERGKLFRDLFGSRYPEAVKSQSLDNVTLKTLEKHFEKNLKTNFRYAGIKVTPEGVIIFWKNSQNKVKSTNLEEVLKSKNPKQKSNKIDELVKFLDPEIEHQYQAFKFIKDHIAKFISKTHKGWDENVFWNSDLVNNELLPIMLQAPPETKFSFQPIDDGFYLTFDLPNNNSWQQTFLRKDYDENFNYKKPKKVEFDNPKTEGSIFGNKFPKQKEYLKQLTKKYSIENNDPTWTIKTKIETYLRTASPQQIGKFEEELQDIIDSFTKNNQELKGKIASIERDAMNREGMEAKGKFYGNLTYENFVIGDGKEAQDRALILKHVFDAKALIEHEKTRRGL